MFARFFVDRPIFATVLSLVIIIVGLVALTQLPIAQYPSPPTPPTIQVSALYPGADAETVATTVATPIEQEINGVERMLYLAVLRAPATARCSSTSPSSWARILHRPGAGAEPRRGGPGQAARGC